MDCRAKEGIRPGRAAALLLVAGALAALSCKKGGETALDAVVSWTGVSVDQLEFSVVPAAGGTRLAIVPPTLRPAAPAGALASPQDVIIRVRDELDGTAVKCRVSGLLGGELQQLAESAAINLSGHETVTCAVALAAGAAGLRLPNGSACLDDRQCSSRFCVDGLCCDVRCDATCMACDLPGSPGLCAFVSAGSAPRDPAQCLATAASSCGTDGRCDGHGACRKQLAGTPCADGRCQGSVVADGKVCDGKGLCAPGPALSCAPFLCDAAATPARCLDRCAGDADCVSGRPCLAGSCGPRPDGGVCASDAQCQSGHCADGLCCNSVCDGPCLACNLPGLSGMCRPVAAGSSDPHGRCTVGRATDPASCGQSGACDGNGACALYAAETLCRPAACSGTVVMKAGTCDGVGVCQSGGTLRCSPYGCQSGRCNASCAVDGDCAPGQTCDAAAMSCGPKGLGQTCGAAAECASGFCVDAVCCNELCDGACRSCALASSMGVCKNVAAGAADPRATCHASDVATCGNDGLCDGNGACRRYAAGTVCAPESCAGSARTLAARCDAAGACAAGGMLTCAPYLCNGSTACFTSCARDADCVPPNVCLGGACGLKPNGAACGLGAECASGHCTDGVCCDSDSCGTCRACNLAGAPGRCAAVPALAAEPHGACPDQGAGSCGGDGKCDGAGQCHLYAAGTMCGAGGCTGSTLTFPSACNGAGACVAGTQHACVPFVCGTGACKTTCLTSGDCTTPNQCMGGSCGLKPLGGSCGAGGECASGHCTDGVCCDSAACGSCQACNVPGRPGSCQNVAVGAPDPRGACAAQDVTTCGRTGACDGSGGCQLFAAGSVCAAGLCVGNSVLAASACDGAGRCLPAVGGSDCTPYVCRAGACATACATDADCVAPAACVGSICRRKPTGAGCTAAAECDSGSCVDGVCCGSPSCATCQACNVPGFVGACAGVGAGAPDPHGRCAATPAASCGLDGACDGAGACRKWTAGTFCLGASCSAKKRSQNPKTCDGAGLCADRGAVNCAPDDCDTATGLCP